MKSMREGGIHFFWAARKGCRLDLFQRILDKIDNVNVCDIWNTALMEAVSHNYLDFVTALMNHPDIDVNAQNSIKETALHLAVEKNHTAALATLLSDDRIDCSLTNNGNETPLMMAIRSGKDECERILREHGAPEPSLDWLKLYETDEDDFFGGEG